MTQLFHVHPVFCLIADSLIPASAAYLVGALILIRRWMRDSEWAVSERERHVVLATTRNR